MNDKTKALRNRLVTYGQNMNRREYTDLIQELCKNLQWERGLTKEKQKEFNKTVRPAIKWLNENCNPHVSITITPTSATLKTNEYHTGTIMDYVKD